MTSMVAALLLCVLLPMTVCAGGKDTLQAVAQKAECQYEDLLQSELFVPGESVSDWIAIAAGCSGNPVKRSAYLDGLETYVTERYAEEGGLHNIKATEWHRISLAVMALGGDPTNFGIDTSGEPINLIADGTYNWSMSDSLGMQGLNGWIFALITMDAKCFEVPLDAVYTRESIIEEIVKSQTDEGGFGLAGGSPDVDITAMALQALAPYYQSDFKVQGAVDRAVWWLSSQQSNDGDFAGWGSGNAEGTAQTIIALCSLGIDPRTDERFCKNGVSALDGLMRYQCENGMFRHVMDDGEDVMATEQAALALISLERMDQGGDRLYDMMNITIYPEELEKTENISITSWIIAVSVAIVIGVVVVLIIRRGKKRVCMK